MRTITRVAVVALGLLFFPVLTFAACQTDPNGFSSPLNVCTIQDFVVKALKALVTIAIPIIGFFIVLVGFQFVVAQGKEAALTKAKKNFLYVIIGAALVLGAWVLATLIGATISGVLA